MRCVNACMHACVCPCQSQRNLHVLAMKYSEPCADQHHFLQCGFQSTLWARCLPLPHLKQPYHLMRQCKGVTERCDRF